MRQSRRRTGGRRPDADKIKYIRMASIPLVAVIVLVIIIVVMDRKPGDKEAAATTAGTESLSDSGPAGGDVSSLVDKEGTKDTGVEPDNSQYTTDFSDYELQKDAVPQVNLLISEYFQAKIDQDAEKLFSLFGKAADGSLEARREELKNEAVYIEDYQDIVCYTKPGMTEDAYVAYVTYDVKFKRVDTLAPGLMWCYLLKDDSGNFIIRENVVGEEADYVAKQNQSEDVLLLSKQVNERLRQAIESDTLLAGIYGDLRNGAVVNPSEEEGQDSMVVLEDELPEGADGSGEAASGNAADGSGQDGAGQDGESVGDGQAGALEGDGADGGGSSVKLE